MYGALRALGRPLARAGSRNGASMGLRRTTGSVWKSSLERGLPALAVRGIASAPQDLKMIKTLASTLESSEKEVSMYLRMYKQSHQRKFGVIKVGGGVLENEMEDLCESISQLTQLGLIPIIVHGAGPQLNRALKEAGITSSYVNGLRVTTPEILAVARKVFQATNLKAVKALEDAGVRARPVQSGVFEVDLFDNGSLGQVGSVKKVHLDAVDEALSAGCVPVLTCMGQTTEGQFLNVNADTAAQTLAQAVQPLKVVYLSANGGLLDNNREVIQSIDVNYDFDYLMGQFKHGDARKLLEIKELMATLPRSSTVSVTSAGDLAKELLTHSLSGTLITNKERLHKFKSLKEVDEYRLLVLLEQSFGAPMVPNYLDMIRDSIHSIYVSENYLACSIVTNQVGLPYLSKFAVSQTAQMEGLGKRLWEDMVKDIPTMMWRSRTVNPINKWYFQRSTGSATGPDWTVFWYGIQNYADALEPMAKTLALPKDVARPPPKASPVVDPLARKMPKAESQWCQVGLLGARGHTGMHLIRFIEKHPDLKLAVAASRSMAGQPVTNLVPEADPTLEFKNLSAEDVAGYDKQVDLWFLAMPDKQSGVYLPAIGDDTPVVDLSADHRFDNEWVYGMPEIDPERRKAIRLSNRIANPGCYATGMMTSLRPLLQIGKRYRSILGGSTSAFGVSGYSGAGTTPSPKNDPNRLHENLMAYKLQGHTHEREVGYQLKQISPTLESGIRFTPHVASFFQGIHLTIHVELTRSITREDLIARYRAFYEKERLISVVDDIPEVVSIVDQPGVVIGGFSVSDCGKQIVLTTVIDNLMKGASVQAMQNANLVLGLNEYTSILPEYDLV